MVADRGWCINSFAQVEYLLGDLLWQAASMPEYAAAAVPFPLNADKRAEKVRELLELSGPFEAYGADLREIVERWESLREGRLFFAHGYASFFSTPAGDALMQIRRFVPPPKGSKGAQMGRDVLRVRPAELAEARRVWAKLANDAALLFHRIHEDLGLERPDDIAHG
jgi:hypothetical protein